MALDLAFPPIDYWCHRCGATWISIYTGVTITECPIHGKRGTQKRRLQSLTRQLQRSIYGTHLVPEGRAASDESGQDRAG